jgi:short-subunit dehydrogenase
MHVAITGASSGIGEALAREYLAREAAVTLIARRVDRLHALAREVGGKTHVVGADLTDVEHACDWIPEAEQRLGSIDVLINNAGASMVHPTVATDWQEAESLFRLNVLTPFKLTCRLAPSMVERGRGCIVDISSLAALVPSPGFFFYSASKAALAAGSESLRAELRQAGVHVLTVYPGPVHTPMAAANFAVFDPSVARFSPTGDVRVLARLIARAVEKRRARIIYPRIYAIARIAPWFASWLVNLRTLEMLHPRAQARFDTP